MKTLTEGLDAPNIHIEIEPPSPEPLLLKDGAYVYQGQAVLEQLRLLGLSDDIKNILPSGQTDEGSVLGSFMSYGISPVTKRNINSMHYNNCLAFIAVGVEREEGQQIGIQSHIVDGAPSLLITNEKELMVADVFKSDMHRILCDLRQLSKHQTVDVLIAGGSISLGKDRLEDVSIYVSTVESIDAIVREVLGRSATVLAPSIGNLWKYISTETQDRTVRIRPKPNQQGELSTKIFLASDVRSELPKILP